MSVYDDIARKTGLIEKRGNYWVVKEEYKPFLERKFLFWYERALVHLGLRRVVIWLHTHGAPQKRIA